ncbi:hypothetical protein [Paraburkholderia sp. RL17-337-BIB-A]
MAVIGALRAGCLQPFPQYLERLYQCAEDNVHSGNKQDQQNIVCGG